MDQINQNFAAKISVGLEVGETFELYRNKYWKSIFRLNTVFTEAAVDGKKNCLQMCLSQTLFLTKSLLVCIDLRFSFVLGVLVTIR